MELVHGLELEERVAGTQAIEDLGQSVIGIIGTASRGPVNEPTVILGKGEEDKAVELFGAPEGSHTIPRAIADIFSVTSATLVIIRVPDRESDADVAASIVARVNAEGQASGAARFLDSEAITGVVPGLLIAPRFSMQKPVVDALVEVAKKLRAHVIVDGPNTTKEDAVAYRRELASRRIYLVDPWVRVFSAEEAKATEARDDVDSQVRNLEADLERNQSMESALSSQKLAADRLTEERKAVKDAADGALSRDRESTELQRAATEAAARYEEAVAKRDSLKAKLDEVAARIAGMLREKEKKEATLVAAEKSLEEARRRASTPPSPFVAALIAKTDKEEGFWVSPSNHTISGIVGTDRPISFRIDDPDCEANYLNANDVTTIVRLNGWRLWGNHVCFGLEEKAYKFITRSRICDAIDGAILRSAIPMVDKNINKSFFAKVTGDVEAYLRLKVAQGALVGGKCWADPSVNTAEVLANGQAVIDYDFTDVPTGEKLKFRRYITNKYLSEVMK